MANKPRTTAQQDALAPIDTAVTFLLLLFLGSAVLFTVVAGVQLATTGTSTVSIGGVGSGSTCVDVDQQGVGGISTGSSGNLGPGGGGLQAGEAGLVDLRGDRASAVQQTWTVCLDDATPPQRIAAGLTSFGPYLYTVGSLLLIYRTVRSGRRRGLFAETTARTVRQLGQFLLLGATLGCIALAACRGVVVEAAIAGVSWTDQLWAPDIAWLLTLVSIGILTFARVLRRAVPLQAEYNATV